MYKHNAIICKSFSITKTCYLMSRSIYFVFINIHSRSDAATRWDGSNKTLCSVERDILERLRWSQARMGRGLTLHEWGYINKKTIKFSLNIKYIVFVLYLIEYNLKRICKSLYCVYLRFTQHPNVIGIGVCIIFFVFILHIKLNNICKQMAAF